MNAYTKMKLIKEVEKKYEETLSDRELFSLNIMQRLDEIKDKEMFYKDTVEAITNTHDWLKLLITNLNIIALLVCSYDNEDAFLLAQSDKFKELVSFTDIERVLLKPLQ